MTDPLLHWQLCAYELQRLRNIENNNATLRELGLLPPQRPASSVATLEATTNAAASVTAAHLAACATASVAAPVERALRKRRQLLRAGYSLHDIPAAELEPSFQPEAMARPVMTALLHWTRTLTASLASLCEAYAASCCTAATSALHASGGAAEARLCRRAGPSSTKAPSATATDHLQRTGAHANHHAVRAVHASICGAVV